MGGLGYKGLLEESARYTRERFEKDYQFCIDAGINPRVLASELGYHTTEGLRGVVRGTHLPQRSKMDALADLVALLKEEAVVETEGNGVALEPKPELAVATVLAGIDDDLSEALIEIANAIMRLAETIKR